MNEEIRNWKDSEALERYKIISPLMDESLDKAKKIMLRKEIAQSNGISEKTLRRYEAALIKDGFNGLRPKSRDGHRTGALPENFKDLLSEAIQLKREVPTRSVSQIIFILEGEGRVPSGVLKRSTLQRYLFNEGFGRKQMRQYNDARKSSTKRFCKPNRMMLVQADIKYGPFLPIGKDGKMVRTYLSSIIDDHSRHLLFSEFFDNQEGAVIEESYRKAILLCGKFDATYTDNGKQYISAQLQHSLAQLGIRVKHAPVRSGKSKGKIERLHRTVDQFIEEQKVKKVKTLEELNHYWECFREEYYEKKPHDGIKEYYESMGVEVPAKGISPLEEWNRDKRALVYIDTSVVGNAFLHHETRIIDKAGCISFKGQTYEVSVDLIGAKVEIFYDPMDTSTITVKYRDMDPIEAKPVKIGEYCSKQTPLPVSMQQESPVTSRFLDVVENKHRESRKLRTDAISYGSYTKEDEDT